MRDGPTVFDSGPNEAGFYEHACSSTTEMVTMITCKLRQTSYLTLSRGNSRPKYPWP